ncbi:dehydrogenase/reductase SDR family member on chromosome X isoform X4 [Arachis ipaensis]|uniref:dehydrogenase/reductase SDR family member on chromosome X isoform X4 n=1 Tax=Arachis ipaensis TaxID=130454 RepID=UPI0007AF481E|nr:dehydrogenase/reductase SDR family member on chromosome X isoform X4 [Arachis ipaensis]XP_025667871.1 dehydrogenase/reductase SDR family member on chromosome X isoform X3 [Arachis hypogaea]
MISLVKELWRTLLFVFSIQFWRMGLLWTFSIVFSHYQLIKDFLCSQRPKSYYRCSPCVVPVRPVAVVTGATSGLGFYTAYELSKEGYVVVLVGRSQQLLLEAERKIKDWNRNAHLKAFQVDLSSVESIIMFRKSLQQWLSDSDLHSSIQLLINSAGILATSPRITADGYDQMIGTNYIGAFVLTNLLLPLLESSNVSSRIVNVTSFTHRNVCLLLFTFELHRQLRLREKSHQIFVAAADPGVVQTNILREVPSLLSLLAHFVLKHLGLLQSPEYGVSSIIDAALAPPGTSGAYFFGGIGRTIEPSILSRDAGLALKLWETTSNLLSTTPFGAEDD